MLNMLFCAHCYFLVVLKSLMLLFFFLSSAGSKTGNSPIFNIPSSAPARKTVADDFLNSEIDKNDYDWYVGIVL